MASAADRFILERTALTRGTNPPAAISSPPSDSGKFLVDPGEGTVQLSDGLRTAGLLAVRVSVLANSGQTLSGGGTLDCWIYDDAQTFWFRLPELDLQVNWPGPGSTTVRRGRMFPGIRIPPRLGGRVLWVANGITVSGGTDVLVRIDGFIGAFPS